LAEDIEHWGYTRRRSGEDILAWFALLV
jgi:hypothetical protein